MFEPFQDIIPYMNRYWEQQPVTNLFQPRPPGGRSFKKREQEQKRNTALLESLIDEALDQLISEDWRTLYEKRLRRQATLFTLAGRKEDARLLCAVASVLQPTSPVAPREQAFLRAMLRFSIQQGPMRIMAESLDPNDLNSMLEMFDNE